MLLHELVGENGYLVRREKLRRIEDLDAEVLRLQKENEHLTNRIQELRSDPATIEKLARERIGLGRENDLVVALPQEEPMEPGNQPVAENFDDPESSD